MVSHSGDVIRTRSNGVVPHCSQALDCRLNGHVGPLQKRTAKALITGGGGYVGYHLGCALASEEINVVLFDRQKPRWEIPDRAVFFQGDMRDYEAVFRACEGVDCVFHMASYGMSGPEQLQSKELIESINIGGTKIIIQVCQERNISRLIYTSSVNVVFGGIPIEEGDETVPYFPLEKHTDHYSRTKAIADRMILAADGTLLKGGDKLHTCVIRPPGIYGPEEQRHLPRVAKLIQRQLFRLEFWSPDTLMNWVHLHNLVQGHLLASAALTAERGYIAFAWFFQAECSAVKNREYCAEEMHNIRIQSKLTQVPGKSASGQAYYINDGENVIFSEWITPLFEKLGYRKPQIHIPPFLVHAAAALLEYLHLLLKPVFNFTPVMTRAEVIATGFEEFAKLAWRGQTRCTRGDPSVELLAVLKIRNLTVTHTFRIDKAREQLGYYPKKFTLADTVDHYLKTRPPCQNEAFSPMLFLMFGMFLCVMFLSFLFLKNV